MMFLDCPAYLDEAGARCGLPAEVRCRFIMRSTDGPLESAMIRAIGAPAPCARPAPERTLRASRTRGIQRKKASP
jgi:hypothetical protein